MNVQNFSGDEARGYAVNTAEVYPFNRQALGHLNNTGLGCVVL
jgi:hypothetical protein